MFQCYAAPSNKYSTQERHDEGLSIRMCIYTCVYAENFAKNILRINEAYILLEKFVISPEISNDVFAPSPTPSRTLPGPSPIPHSTDENFCERV